MNISFLFLLIVVYRFLQGKLCLLFSAISKQSDYLFPILRQSLYSKCATSGGEGVGEDPPCPILKIEKSALIQEKSTLSVCIYGLNSPSKCTFKNILEKKAPKFFNAVPFFCISYRKRLSKCPYSRKPPLPQQIPGCTSAFPFLISLYLCILCHKHYQCLSQFKLDLIHRNQHLEDPNNDKKELETSKQDWSCQKIQGSKEIKKSS